MSFQDASEHVQHTLKENPLWAALWPVSLPWKMGIRNLFVPKGKEVKNVPVHLVQLGVKTSLHSMLKLTNFAIKNTVLRVPIIPHATGMKSTNQAIADAKTALNKTNWPKYYRKAQDSGKSANA